jgi:acylphosphatase
MGDAQSVMRYRPDQRYSALPDDMQKWNRSIGAMVCRFTLYSSGFTSTGEDGMEKHVRAHAIITGRVQGVWYRMETKQAADLNGVVGWVRNQRDGSVEAVFEGPEDAVKSALAWCWKGPPLARVEHVDVRWEPYVGEFKRFDVTY